jgi:hypothetical protein
VLNPAHYLGTLAVNYSHLPWATARSAFAGAFASIRDGCYRSYLNTNKELADRSEFLPLLGNSCTIDIGVTETLPVEASGFEGISSMDWSIATLTGSGPHDAAISRSFRQRSLINWSVRAADDALALTARSDPANHRAMNGAPRVIEGLGDASGILAVDALKGAHDPHDKYEGHNCHGDPGYSHSMFINPAKPA